MAYASARPNTINTTEERAPMNKEQIANVVALTARNSVIAAANTTKAVGRGFWQGLLGNAYVEEPVAARPTKRTARR